MPIVILYYTKLTLSDYIRALFNKYYEENYRLEMQLDNEN